MMFSSRKPKAEAYVLSLKISEIRANPSQPRRYFDEDSLTELAFSIQTYGILNPLIVRRVDETYELVAGERRLRAAKLAGLTEVPCLLIDADGQKSGFLALVENLQRNDLNFFEEAVGFRSLIETYALTQEEVANRVGKSQSAVANKLRLLRLTRQEAEQIQQSGLTERHARALLRLGGPEERMRALQVIIERGYNVSATEEYIDSLLSPPPPPDKPSVTPLRLIRDVRFFLNTVNRAVEVMRQAGLSPDCERVEDEDGLTLKIYIPHHKYGSAAVSK